jgi:flagellar biosynthesis protein
MEKKAVALKKYVQKLKVVGKGKGYIAQVILEFAKENNIPIEKDEILVEKLFDNELYEEIPDELYEYVVRVLDFLYNKRNSPKEE